MIPTPAHRGRLAELDSLRGLAALSVVFGHFRTFWLQDAMLHASTSSRRVFLCLTYPFCAGAEAVILFFILSGFVLSIPAIESRAQSYPVFVVRRIFRIYFPYLVALSAAILCDALLHGHITQSEWFNQSWNENIDWRLVAQHVLFIGKYNTNQFDNPVWSLVHEMRISLIFPFLCALVLKLKPAQSLAFAAALSCTALIVVNLFSIQGLFNPFIYTLHFIAFFVLGIYLARKRERISAALRQLSKLKRAACFVLAALLYIYGGIFSDGVARLLTSYNTVFITEWMTALGAAGLVALSLSSRSIQRVLLWRPVHILGEMSYSVYLLHLIVLFALIHLLYGKLPVLLIDALCLVITLAVSWGFYRQIEIPLITLGRRLSAKL
jgi:peptidoglycan/LPS O-acetylase OafA/YrhL